MERLSHVVMTVDDALPLDQRIHEVVRQRVILLEAITPVRRAAAVHAPFSHEVSERLQAGHDYLRGEIERVFSLELAACPASERSSLLDALDTVLSWASWDNLRSLNGRSQDDAGAVLLRMVTAIVHGAT